MAYPKYFLIIICLCGVIGYTLTGFWNVYNIYLHAYLTPSSTNCVKDYNNNYNFAFYAIPMTLFDCIFNIILASLFIKTLMNLVQISEKLTIQSEQIKKEKYKLHKPSSTSKTNSKTNSKHNSRPITPINKNNFVNNITITTKHKKDNKETSIASKSPEPEPIPFVPSKHKYTDSTTITNNTENTNDTNENTVTIPNFNDSNIIIKDSNHNISTINKKS